MNIDYLRYFVEVSKYKSISLVAKKHHITQSALSQQLSKLEQTLDVKLLHRSNKGVSLTTEGSKLLEYCEQVLSNYDKLLENILNLSQAKNSLTIEAIEALSTNTLPKVLGNMKLDNSKFNLTLKSNNDFNLSNLINSLTDIYISYNNYDMYEDIISKKVGKDKLLLVGDESYPVTQVNIYDFLYLPFIYNENFDLSFLKDIYNIEISNIIYKTNSFSSTINGLSYSKAVTIIPESIYMAYKDTHKLKVIDVLGFKSELDIYISYNFNFSKNNSNFLKPFISELKTIINNTL